MLSRTLNGKNILALAILLLVATLGWSQTPVGWATLCSDGKVYKCKLGGNPTLLWSGGGLAEHSRWSIDGRYIYFQRRDGQIWVMNNDGSDAKMIYAGSLPVNTNEYYPRIEAYRPDPNYVLYNTNNKFYKIDRNGTATLIHTDTRNFWGETGINTAGTRMVARSDVDLFKITVGGQSTKYWSRCSASLSPDGEYMLHNDVGEGNYETWVFKWDNVSSYWKAVSFPNGAYIDNQVFSVNSNDYFTYWFHDGAPQAVGLTRISDNAHFRIGNILALNGHFFLGEIPAPSGIINQRASVTDRNMNIYRSDLTTTNSSFSGQHQLFDIRGRLIAAIGLPVPVGQYIANAAGKKPNSFPLAIVK